MYPLLLAVNQMLPLLSATRPCGPDPSIGNGYSLICPVVVSTRPSLLANCPVYQSAPSGVASGSCGREPLVGTAHSLKLTLELPRTITAGGLGFSKKCAARYSVMTDMSFFGRSTNVEMTCSHSGFV